MAPGGDGRTDRRKKKTEKISLCGDAIGHLPLRGRCPKGEEEMKEEVGEEGEEEVKEEEEVEEKENEGEEEVK